MSQFSVVLSVLDLLFKFTWGIFSLRSYVDHSFSHSWTCVIVFHEGQAWSCLAILLITILWSSLYASSGFSRIQLYCYSFQYLSIATHRPCHLHFSCDYFMDILSISKTWGMYSLLSNFLFDLGIRENRCNVISGFFLQNNLDMENMRRKVIWVWVPHLFIF